MKFQYALGVIITNKPTLVLMVGLPGSGKTTLALAISHRLGWPMIDKDTLKATLLLSGFTDEFAGPAAYELMFAIGRDILVEQRLSVILDSPFPLMKRITELVDDADAKLKMILCLTEKDVRNHRVAERSSKLSQPVGISTTEGDGHELFTYLPLDTLMIDTTQPLMVIIEHVIHYLEQDKNIG